MASSTPLPEDPAVESLVSAERFSSYLEVCGGDVGDAVELYEWSVRLTGACFEAFHYVEIVVRNSIDREMHEHRQEERRGIPWFMMPLQSKSSARFEDGVTEVRKRLRRLADERESRDQIVAGLSFGFWVDLFRSEHDDLWKKVLHRAFPGSSGKRADVMAALGALQGFRNRLAHHDSLLRVDVAFRLSQMRDVLRWVEPAAEAWFDTVERVSAVLHDRPTRRSDDDVVVAAGTAWPFYRAAGAYVCQAGRSFRPVERVAFYSQKQVHAEVPLVRRRVDHVEWSHAEVNRLRRSGSEDDLRLADVITAHLGSGWPEGRNQVFILSRPGEGGHEALPRSIPHLATGKGSAFVQAQRYTTLQAMVAAHSTTGL